MTIKVPVTTKPSRIFDRVEPFDAPDFLEATEAVAKARIEWANCSGLIVVRIDNWFGPRWLGFMGKIVGAAGTRRYADPVVPPFVPNRVVDQTEYRRAETGEWASSLPLNQLHVSETSEANIRRRVAHIAPNSALLWVSGNSATNHRGSLMIYSPDRSGYMLHYSGLIQDDRGHWSVHHREDVGANLVRRSR